MNKLIMALVLGVVGATAFAESKVESTKPVVVQTKDAKLNINTANAQQIAKSLNGVGIKKAEAIVAYRTQNGPFKTSGDLLKVKGMGLATFKKNAELIAFN